MNDITKTPTPTLIAMHDEQTIFGDKDSGFANAIAAELDRRCEDAGIGLYKDGSFWYSQRTKDDHENMFAITTCNTQQISAREQHALEEWLLIREGK